MAASGAGGRGQAAKNWWPASVSHVGHALKEVLATKWSYIVPRSEQGYVCSGKADRDLLIEI
jgi:hypothetical protein